MKSTNRSKDSGHASNSHSVQRKGNNPFFSGNQHQEETSPVNDQDVQTFLQPRLNFGKPNDKFEQEADAVADKVVAGQDSFVQQSVKDDEKVQGKPAFESPGVMDAAELSESEDPKIQEKEKDTYLQSKRESDTNDSGSLEQSLQQSRGGGDPLPDETRSEMESGMGADFSNVRVHTGADAVQMNEDLHSQAFTSGSDIYFNQGKYDPGTKDGDHLLAHELTHTVQQGAAGNESTSIQNKTDDEESVQKQEQDVKTPGLGETTQSLTPVDISTAFKPNPAMAAYLDEKARRRYVEVPVKLGKLARGNIKVRQRKPAKEGTEATYLIARRQALPFSGVDFLNPLREKNIEPVIALSTTDPANITGFVSLRIGRRVLPNPKSLIHEINKNLELLGLLGVKPLKVPGYENKVVNGVLTLKTIELKTTVAGYLDATGSFGLTGERFIFELNTHVDVNGLAQGDFKIARDEKGILAGEGEIAVAIANLSGKVKATYLAGDVTILGSVAIESEKFSGSVSLMLADRKTAKQTMMAELGVESLDEEKKKKPTLKKAKKKTKKNQVLIGWGTITARITPWLEGTAKVGIDDIGQVTIVGEIVVPSEVELMEQKGKKVTLFELEIKAGYGIPLVGQVGLFAGIGMFVSAGFGPLVLRNVSFEGTYSTDPSVLQQFMITGTLGISAFAIIGLEAKAGVFVTLIGHDIKAGIKVTAAAGIRAYAEATPTFEYKEVASPAGGKVGEAWLKGHFEAAAQLFLKLAGDFFVELDSPWWSPAPDKTWEYPLGDVEYPIGPSMGIGGDVEWLVGSPEVPELKFSPVDFDPDKFTSDIMADPPPGKGGGKGGEKKGDGKWEDKSKKPGKEDQPELKKDNKGLEGKKKEDPSKWPDEKRYMRALGEIGKIGDASKKAPVTYSVLDAKLKKIKRKYRIDQILPKSKTDGSVKVFVKHARQNNSKNQIQIQLMSEAERQRLVKEAKMDLERKQASKVDPKVNKIKESESKAIATEIGNKHPVIESLKVIDGKDTWNYELDLGDRKDIVRGIEKFEAEAENKEHEEKVKKGLEEITKLESGLNQDGGIRKSEAEKIAQDVKKKHPVFKSIIVIDGEDSWDYDYVASPGKTHKTKSKKEERMDEAMKKLKKSFGKERFAPSEADEVLAGFISPSTRRDYVNIWEDDKKIFVYGSSKKDPLKKLTFDATKKGKRNIPAASKRFIFGFSNPSHDSKTGIKVLAKGVEEEKSPEPIKKENWNYLSKKAWFSSKRPNSKYVWSESDDQSFKRKKAILGHREPPGASGYWNDNMNDREHNKAWNKDSNNYWGPEHEDESSASGGKAERYQDPDPKKADEMWWDPTHPNYPGKQSWGTGYDWDFRGVVKK